MGQSGSIDAAIVLSMKNAFSSWLRAWLREGRLCVLAVRSGDRNQVRWRHLTAESGLRQGWPARERGARGPEGLEIVVDILGKAYGRCRGSWFPKKVKANGSDMELKAGRLAGREKELIA